MYYLLHNSFTTPERRPRTTGAPPRYATPRNPNDESGIPATQCYATPHRANGKPRQPTQCN
eukprot:6054258-Lingulodinium_polyedra.AAC.1